MIPPLVLVVEDQRIVAMDILSSLRRLGYTAPISVASGEEALREVEKLHPDLVLMDIGLKGAMDGVATAQEVRERFDVPVVFLTAHTDEATLRRAKVSEPFGYILKPFEERELSTSVEMALHKHRMERELRESRQWFATTLRSIGDAVLATGPDGVVLFMNPVAEALTGWTQEEAIGQDCGEVFRVVDEQSRAPVENPVARVLREGTTLSLPGPLGLVGRDGREQPIGGSAAPIRDNRGRVIGAVLAFWDDAERRRLEMELRQAQKLEAVGRLAGGIAHDFNNLLTIISGYGNLLLSDLNRNDPSYGFAEEVLKAGDRAAALTRQLLAFSRKQIVQPVVFRLNDVVAEMGKMLHRLIGEPIDLQTDLAPDLHPIRADPASIEQVLLNLAVNARDAMPRGGALSLATANVTVGEAGAGDSPGVPPGDYVRLQVRDTGHGMDAETLTHVFEPFFTTKGPGKGTGLGLATVYGIVKQSLGHIFVASQPGAGTTFTIYFPTVLETPVRAATRSSLADAPRGDERVLVVEDDGSVRRLICQVLQALGYSVQEASDAEEALTLAGDRAAAWDLLLTDVVMPGMSGRELADRLLADRPALRVLFLSGYSDDAVLRTGVQTDSTPFLHKPFRPHILARKVREVLDKPV